MLDDRVRVVSVVHVPTNGGLINPVSSATGIKRKGATVPRSGCSQRNNASVPVMRPLLVIVPEEPK